MADTERFFYRSDEQKVTRLISTSSSSSSGQSAISQSRSKSVKKYVMCVFLLLIVIAFLVWETFAYIEVKRSLNRLLDDVQVQNIQIQQMKNEVSMKKKMGFSKSPQKQSKFVSINLCGRNDQTEQSRQGRPFSDWATTVKVGDISYNLNYIVIKVPGIYQVYAQMFFQNNKNHYNGTAMDFFIAKNRAQPLALTSVPVNTCKVACTRHISRVVNLTREDHLSITSSVSGIQFRMSRHNSYFGVFLLKPT